MINNILIFTLHIASYFWGIAGLLIALLFFLTGPTAKSSYQNPLLKTSVTIVLRWGSGTAWLLLALSSILRKSDILSYPLLPAWFGYTGLALFFLSVAALIYDRAIASGAMKN